MLRRIMTNLIDTATDCQVEIFIERAPAQIAADEISKFLSYTGI
jgi:hypothetical protein